METFNGYPKDMPDFLNALVFNNNREWFNLHKVDYTQLVVEPSLALIRALDPVVRSLSSHYSGDPRRLGGSLMRPYRDTRFSKDKTPYKTNIGIQFRHHWAKDVHAPGFYLHFEPSTSFFGAGTWRPEAEALLKIRHQLAEDSQAYLQALGFAHSQAGLQGEGERLKRVPRGFSPDHPMNEDLKLKDFLVSKPLPQEAFFSRDLVELVTQLMAASAPYMSFLCRSLEVPF